jgi:hypothetical protein
MAEALALDVILFENDNANVVPWHGIRSPLPVTVSYRSQEVTRA